ncbi:hypothetical protein Goshw_005592 [Gossypium schwendimanii]|uniref:RNase H type-1 domain-containing protein n=1 Tax=Gossypium schwendimanii TaxID=34291 RepID=A0A7J9L139_GOSSC|nr:hypothetical protein [Gossypium schwendimanii]
MDAKAAADFLTLLWNCWSSRNNRIFMDNKDSARKTKPPTGVIKINFDAMVSNGRMGYGVIARDKDGFVVGGSGGLKSVQ